MIISLLGYMGSGKTSVAELLTQELNFEFIDLDAEIISLVGMQIHEIFHNKGELFFRKTENKLLLKILDTQENAVLSLGGGTPAYYNNMKLINEYSESFFLRASVKTLSERLSFEKNQRPIISKINNDDLPGFIAKHLFERNPFYNQAKHTIDVDGKTIENISSAIISLI